MLKIGLRAESINTVDKSNTALAVGSGDLEVFATPAMITKMEGAAMVAVAHCLEEGTTTVGTAMTVSHVKASKIGACVKISATVTAIVGRRITFKVEACDDNGEIIGEGVHTRYIVDRAKFMEKVNSL